MRVGGCGLLEYVVGSVGVSTMMILVCFFFYFLLFFFFQAEDGIRDRDG